jgi:hypothetical protein
MCAAGRSLLVTVVESVLPEVAAELQAALVRASAAASIAL